MQDPIIIDAIWLTTAFFMGFIVRRFQLPSLIGFLFTGLILNSLHLAHGNISHLLDTLSDLGVMLLLFTIGLKIKLKSVLEPEIWVTAGINMIMSIIIIGGFVFMLSMVGLQTIGVLSFTSCMLIGFALSFSSTVFVVKILEERGELTSFHGRIAIGILVIQDVFAVVFMTAASDLKPGWSILLLPVYLYVARYVLKYILKHSGHGELLTIFGFFATFIAGALVFYLFGIKPDLGALVIGMLLVSHKKADELYDRMMSYKDFFLVAFFIDVGLTGSITLSTLIITALLILFMFVKGVIFMLSMSRFKMRARTAFLAALSLSNYSEFALITGMVGYNAGWISNDWIIGFALLMSTSFLISSPLNSMAHRIFDNYRPLIMRLNRGKKYIDEEPKSIGDAEYLVIGYGSIGRPAYHYLSDITGLKTIAIDYNHEIVKKQKSNGININWGDTTNSIFWENIDLSKVKVVFLAMSDFQSNVNTLKEVIKLKDRHFKIGAFCAFVDEAKKLKDLKVDYVYDYKIYQGADFAEQVFHKYSAGLKQLPV